MIFFLFLLFYRYEFGNKGADIFIESLARLNHYLKESKSDKTVVAFLIFPTKTNSFNVESLRGQAVMKALKVLMDMTFMCRIFFFKFSNKNFCQPLSRSNLSFYLFIFNCSPKDTIDDIQKDLGKRMYEKCLRGQVPDGSDLLSKNDIVRLKRCIYAQGSAALPPITTHNIQV